MAIVGQDIPFTVYDDDHVKPYLDSIESDSRAPAIDDAPSDFPGDDGSGRPGGNPDPQVNVLMETMEH